MAKSGIEWINPPKALQQQVMKYSDGLPLGVLAVADFIAVKGQNEMRVRAPWTDRTGNARAGLMGVATREGKNIVIYFVHSLDYGRWLELKNAGRFAIVWPVTLEMGPQLLSMLQRLLA